MAMEQLTSENLSAILKEAHQKGEKEQLTPQQMVQWLASQMNTKQQV
ncbi:hypothetical protein [Jeotgalibacillus terrae]|uniref:Uncharacterized protein n=1 Tax=Jeotgalibacillus terrae TaxID=587735 RepID=A0ABW5ZBY6_9BACL|nr:hypothetical protein [Jeotgalibacillus terrae]MBM7577906.1 hypothetical protein [Jeotgalibacillus terrae]